ncbi:phospholipase effector Tle1 domain-containing protein [Cystobacter fuscus]
MTRRTGTFQSEQIRRVLEHAQQQDRTSTWGQRKQCPEDPLSSGTHVSIFFDGTGNNLEADRDTGEHSNVARLFLDHLETPEQGIYRHYVPGIGTYFREIGDPGGELLGNGAGGKGEDRLKWAMAKLEKCLARSNGRQTLHLALFGFSRGATLARAFALRIAQKCQRRGDGVWLITLGQRTSPIRLYFMGLFDTVASVGPPSASTTRLPCC